MLIIVTQVLTLVIKYRCVGPIVLPIFFPFRANKRTLYMVHVLDHMGQVLNITSAVHCLASDPCQILYVKNV